MKKDEPMIIAKDLARTYEGDVPTYALKGVTFDVAAGEFVAIMGRSGSGKSTLLHQLSLLDTPTAGYIHIEDHDILDLSEHEKAAFRLSHLGYIFQEYALIAELSAEENVYLPAMALGADPKKYKKKARELLGIVGLGERLAHYPHELSGGEQQRVAIARALVAEPAILLADEPTGNLDSRAADDLLQVLRRSTDDWGRTVVMVTHDARMAAYADRIVFMRDGTIVDDARMSASTTPEEIADRAS